MTIGVVGSWLVLALWWRIVGGGRETRMGRCTRFGWSGRVVMDREVWVENILGDVDGGVGFICWGEAYLLLLVCSV